MPNDLVKACELAIQIKDEYAIYESALEQMKIAKARKEIVIDELEEKYDGNNPLRNQNEFNSLFEHIFDESLSALKALRATRKINALDEEINKYWDF